MCAIIYIKTLKTKFVFEGFIKLISYNKNILL